MFLMEELQVERAGKQTNHPLLTVAPGIVHLRGRGLPPQASRLVCITGGAAAQPARPQAWPRLGSWEAQLPACSPPAEAPLQPGLARVSPEPHSPGLQPALLL